MTRLPPLLFCIFVAACGAANPGGEVADDVGGADGAEGEGEAGPSDQGGGDGGGTTTSGEGEGEGEGDGDGEGDGPTWHRDVRPILQARCGGCHISGGGAPFSYETLQDARDHVPEGLVAIRAGRMPPWQPAQDCRRYRDERIIPDAEVEVLAAWVAQGGIEGVEPDAPAAGDGGEELASPDLRFQPREAYVPSPERPDDYRCFPLDQHFEEETYVVRSDVIPGRLDLVHHVLLYRVPADSADELADLDAAEEGPGYTCFGGPGVGGGGPIGAWVPGMVPNATDEGVAFVMPAGTRVVMQIHYNLLNAEPVADLTEWRVWTSDEVPRFGLRTVPQPNLDIVIPAGEASSVHVRDFPNRLGAPVTILGVAPHMHVLGTRIRVEHVNAGGETDCLVDIPEWDFSWQQTYGFRKGEEVVVQPDEIIRLTCEYDNSPSHQAVVNGERLEPRDVRWGEGTLDEMCLNYIHVLEPYVGGGGDCVRFPTCREQCDDPDSFGCWMECLMGDLPCGQCSLGGMVGAEGCLVAPCGAQGLAVRECFNDCLVQAASGGSVLECVEAACPEGWSTLSACMDPVVASGSCDSSVLACGAEL